MLRLMLERGGQVVIPTESMFIRDFARRRSVNGKALTTQDVLRHPKVKRWNVPEVEYTSGSTSSPLNRHRDTLDSHREALEAPYRALARAANVRRWADKTPAYLFCWEEILAIWPNAQFIVMIRDGRDVACSINSLPFGANTPYHAARDWAQGIREGERLLQSCPDQVCVVRYEDLVADPQRWTQAICKFLELSYVPEMLAVEATPVEKVAEGQEAWFANLWAGINQSAVGKWKKRLSAQEIAEVHSVAGAELVRYGYEVEEPGVAPSAGRTALLATRNTFKKLVNAFNLRIRQERGSELTWVLRRKLGRI